MSPGRTPAAHHGSPTGQSYQAQPWSTAITVTTDERVFVRGLALDEAVGRLSFPAMLLRLWRGNDATEQEASLLGACLVASIDHGALAPSALVARTVASTRGAPMSGLAAGIATLSDLHGAAVTRAMGILADKPDTGSLEVWADGVFETERAAGRRIPGVGHRWHANDLRADRLLELASEVSDSRGDEALRALGARVSLHTGKPAPVNIDGALAVALSVLRLDPGYGDFLFALARGFGLAAHFVEERQRERPMRTIDPTLASYDGISPPGLESDG
jgi:citrate synthase